MVRQSIQELRILGILLKGYQDVIPHQVRKKIIVHIILQFHNSNFLINKITKE